MKPRTLIKLVNRIRRSCAVYIEASGKLTPLQNLAIQLKRKVS